MVNSNKEKISEVSKGLTLEGEVISTDMQKTVVVRINRRFKHPLLGKIMARSKKYKVHDSGEQANVGDWVEIVSCKPISKTKSMVLNRILRSAK